jgi:5-methyltetrahydrofolate--homocysteine methyltransferase
MDWNRFVVIGENIHCSRTLKRGGASTTTLPDGAEALRFRTAAGERTLRIPQQWPRVSPAFGDGKVKHVSLAVYQCLNGTDSERADAEAYLCALATRQIAAGAKYLDINVDEYSTEPVVQAETMRFVADLLSRQFTTPLSIDSSKPQTLRAGLACCRRDAGSPMVNSVSLERPVAIELVTEFNADVVVSASGRDGLPADAAARITNLREILGKLETAGIAPERMHLDPLVLPVGTDASNGAQFLEAVALARCAFPRAHIGGGFSNVSFGMPNRRLLNLVFTRLCAEAGADSAILDPVSLPVSAIAGVDMASEPAQLAKALLTGADEFGMAYIDAHRAGRLGGPAA